MNADTATDTDTMGNDKEVPETIEEGEEEEMDEEIRLAMAMAMAAAQNPGLNPAQLRDLCGQKGNNQQADIVEQVKKQKELEKVKEREQAAKKWTEQKENMYSWWKDTTTNLAEGVSTKFYAAAGELQNSAEQQLYADKIKRDPEVILLRKKMKPIRKDLKTKRLASNRVATRHRFKRHRMENYRLTVEQRVEKARRLFCDSNYNLAEYGKAVLRSSRKYKKQGNKEEESLEAMLCRNMHQMLALEKQKVKMRKSNKEVKKYMQRSKGWLSDKAALCEMHVLTLEATTCSMQVMYEDALAKQDKLIGKLQAAPEFEGVDLTNAFDTQHFDMIPRSAGPYATLNALRGLPFNDSIRMARTSGGSIKNGGGDNNNNNNNNKNNKGALYIETADGASVSSALSDPDGDAFGTDSIVSEASQDGFGDDAPWNQGDTSRSPSKRTLTRENRASSEPPQQASMMSSKTELKQPPSTISAPIPAVIVSTVKPTPSAEKAEEQGPETPVSPEEEAEPVSPEEDMEPAPMEEDTEPASPEEEAEPVSPEEDTEPAPMEEDETPVAEPTEESPAPQDSSPEASETKAEMESEPTKDAPVIESGAATTETTPCSTESAEE
jgi:hypothetical protein